MSPPKKKVCFASNVSDSKTNDSIEMDPAVAKKLFKEGAAVVMIDVPPGTEFGIDMNSWNVGEKFMGIKMIPPGIHFVYYSSVNIKHKSVAPRTGFFYNFNRSEIVVRKWDKESEEIKDCVSSDDQERVKADMKNLDKCLGVFPYKSWKKWISLSDHISEATLTRLEPTINRNICSVSDLIPPNPENEAGSSDHQQQHDEEEPRLPALVSRPGSNIRYTEISSRKYPVGSTPSEITKHSMDGTFHLSLFVSSLEKMYGDAVSSSMSHQSTYAEILAEVQFSFLCFLVGMNHDSFEHWKKLIVMLCGCDEGLVTHGDLFIKFVNVLYFQMQEVPSDFFVDIVSSDNFLCNCLNTLFLNGKSNNDVNVQLKQKLSRFEANVTKKFGWDFSQELDEDAPVVVNFDNVS